MLAAISTKARPGWYQQNPGKARIFPLPGMTGPEFFDREMR
jgi:hypothetical protein